MKKPDCKSRIFEERIHLTGTSGSACRGKLSGMSFLCARTRMLTPAKRDRISQIKKEHFVLSNKKYHQYSYSIISPKTSLLGNRPGGAHQSIRSFSEVISAADKIFAWSWTVLWSSYSHYNSVFVYGIFVIKYLILISSAKFMRKILHPSRT